MKKRSGFRVAPLFFLLLLLPFSAASADIESKIAKLPSRTFCVNANIENSWQALAEALEELTIKTTLADKEYHVITTAFVIADSSKLRQITSNSKPVLDGRFTMKISLEAVTPGYTKLNIILQARQKKLFPRGSERLLNSRGNFEKFLASRVNQLAILKQFPGIYEIRLGFDLVANLKTETYRLSRIERNSPAAEAGFKNGDQLLAIDGKPVTIRGELFKALAFDGIEKECLFRVYRKDETLEIPVWVVRVTEMKEKLGLKMDWNEKKHIFSVAFVEPGSRAELAGFQAGDRLLEEGGIRLDSWTNYYRALARAAATAPGEAIPFKVERGGKELEIKI